MPVRRVFKFGETFNHLKYLSDADPKITVSRKRRRALWLCDCGKKKVIEVGSVTNGKSSSCGCRVGVAVALRMTTHGKSYINEYGVWNGMINRCTHEKHTSYSRYGGRGISVCKRWLSIENFIIDMGPRPSSIHQIDRKDNDGNYNAGNCRWVLPIDNLRNRSTTKLNVEMVSAIKKQLSDGNISQKQIGEKYGVHQGTISKISRGTRWSDVT